jgi:hypothetical protein
MGLHGKSLAARQMRTSRFELDRFELRGRNIRR